MANPPKRDFIRGNWSFRHYVREGGSRGFGVWPKGERSGYGRRGDLNVASDGTTWMFCIFVNGVGRDDARPSFELALAKVLKILEGTPNG